MKVLLLQPHDGRVDTSSLLDTTILSHGLLYLASPLIERGHEVSVDLAAEENAVSLLEKHSPDVVGITFTTPKYPAARGVVAKIKAHFPGIPVVLGGHHATFLPEETIRETGADYIIRGEGELVFPKLLEAISSGRKNPKIPGVSFLKDGSFADNGITRVRDLDKLPMPAWDIIPKRYRTRKQRVLSSRGCPFSCDFCSVSAFNAGVLRKRSVGRVLDEVEILLDKGYRMIEFVDDNFTADFQRVVEFSKSIKERGLDFKFGVQSRVDDMEKNPIMIGLLSDCGCYRISLGAESGVQDVLDSYGKRITVEQAGKVSDWMRESEILGYWYFILGSGGAYDTPEVLDKSLAFMEGFKFDVAQVSILTPFPGTRLYSRIKGEGRLITGDWSLYDGSHCVYQPSGLTPEQMEGYFLEAYKRLYVKKGVIELGRKMRKAYSTGFMGPEALLNVAGLLGRAYLLGEGWDGIYERKGV